VKVADHSAADNSKSVCHSNTFYSRLVLVVLSKEAAIIDDSRIYL